MFFGDHFQNIYFAVDELLKHFCELENYEAKEYHDYFDNVEIRMFTIQRYFNGLLRGRFLYKR